MKTDWSRAEVDAIVQDYFDMLARELRGEKFVKAHSNRQLQPRLNGRTRPSIEKKRQNISTVLASRSKPFVRGYKPLRNVQGLLEAVVLEFLEHSPSLFDDLVEGPVLSPISAGPVKSVRFEKLVQPPPNRAAVGADTEERWARATRIDFVRRDAENRRLGSLGEEWVLELEARRLLDEHKRPDLAKKVEWSSRELGDGLGYDIKSFNGDGTTRLIEVKTTGLGKEFPFLVTTNEVAVSRRQFEAYHLYRVFDFATNPRLYVLPGALADTCHLHPTQFRARPIQP